MHKTVLLLALAIPGFAQSCPTGVVHCTSLSWAAGTTPGGVAVGFHVWKGSNCAAVGTPGQPPAQTTPYATVASPTVVAYTDTNVTAGATVCYGLTAYNGYGDSPLSGEVSATTPAFSVPPVPTALSAVAQ